MADVSLLRTAASADERLTLILQLGGTNDAHGKVAIKFLNDDLSDLTRQTVCQEVQIMQGLIDTASKLSKRQKQQMLEERPLLTLMASTYANSILYSLVTKSKGRS